MKIKIGSISNYLVSIMLLFMGLIYLFKSSVMPYHLDALSKNWVDIDKNTQTLFLAFMRAMSGGFLAVAIGISILQKKFKSSKEAWIPGVILTIGLTLAFISLYATFVVRFNTSGRPPIALVVISMALLLIGYVFNRKALRNE